MIPGLISWLVSTLFVTLLAYAVQRPLRAQGTAVNLAIFLFLWIFLVTATMLITGLLGLLAPGPLLLIGTLGTAALLVPPAFRRAFSELTVDLHRFWQSLRAWWRALPRWLRWFSVAAMLLSLLRFAALILIFPPFVWDSLTYHLTNVAQWTQTGRIALFETSMTRIYTPANYETFALWFTVFLHHDVVVEAAGLPAYVLAVVSVYAIGRQIGASPAASWLGALAYGSLPALLLATTGTKNDPHMAAYFLFLIVLLNALTDGTAEERPRALPGKLALIVCTLSYAFGTKAYIGHLAPGLVVIALLGMKKHRGWRTWRRLPAELVHGLRSSGRSARTGLAAAVLLALFLGGYWNIRNWILQGNPFYPYGVQIEEALVLTGAEREAEVSFERLATNFESLFLERFGDKRMRILPDLEDTTGWGWFVYSLGLPALGLALLRSRSLRVLSAGLLTSLIFIFFSIRPSPWNMRYIIWFPALFSFAFAWVYGGLGTQSRLRLWGVRALVMVTLALNFTAMINYGRIPPERFGAMLEIPLLERDAASLRLNMPGEYENTLVIVPEGALLGYNVHANGFIYPLYRANLSQRLVYVPVSITGSCEDVAWNMRERGTRYLFVAPEHTSDAVMAFLNTCGEAERAMRERLSNLYVIKD